MFSATLRVRIVLVLMMALARHQQTTEAKTVTITTDFARVDVDGNYIDAHDGKIIVRIAKKKQNIILYSFLIYIYVLMPLTSILYSPPASSSYVLVPRCTMEHTFSTVKHTGARRSQHHILGYGTVLRMS